MKKLFVTLTLVLPMSLLAEEATDTTVVYHGKQIVITDDSLETRVGILTPDGSQWRKTKESTFVNGQEVERFYVSSPIFGWGSKHRYTPTTPQFYFGFSGFSGKALGLGSTTSMPVKAWRSYEMGVNFMEMGNWLNKQNTWSWSVAYFLNVSNYTLDNRYILLKDEEGKTFAAPTSEGGVRNSRLFCLGTSIEAMVKWYKYFRNPDNDRISLGAGIVLDGFNILNNFSHFTNGGYTYAAAAAHKKSGDISIKLQASYDGMILYFKKSVTPAFHSGEGPKCFRYAFGLGIAF